jgi:uncharacterized spore protein YtfJ
MDCLDAYKREDQMTSTATGERAANTISMQSLNQTIDTIWNATRPSLVFGQPIERGNVTIIPCCEIAMGMGLGGGSGTSPATEKAEKAGGEGFGTGGGVRGRPVATIVITADDVRVEPIVDATKVALAALTTAGFMAFWVARLLGAARGPQRNGSRAQAKIPTMAGLSKALRRS